MVTKLVPYAALAPQLVVQRKVLSYNKREAHIPRCFRCGTLHRVRHLLEEKGCPDWREWNA